MANNNNDIANMELDEEEASWSTEQFNTRTRLVAGDINVQKSELARLTHEEMTMKDKLKENLEKLKLNKQLPYLVANVQELLDQVCCVGWLACTIRIPVTSAWV